VTLQPRDRFDEVLLSNVHPDRWTNPQPAARYDLVVVGAGTAGLVSAAGAAGVGAKVALIEAEHLGGDCLNVGCVPSKALLRSAHVAAEVRDAGRFGVRVAEGASVDFPEVMRRMREVRAGISAADSVQRFSGELGVDVFLGRARFSGPSEIQVGDACLRFKRAVVATGARPVTPSIEGLEEAGYLTNETVFGLTELPRRLLVLGAGPIGCELAQAFRRFGAHVTLVEMGSQFLGREDPDAAQLLRAAFDHDGVDVRLDTQLTRVEVEGAEQYATLRFCDPASGDEKVERLAVDAILVGVGRAPNVEGLGLEEAGIDFDTRRGVAVDDRLRTTNPRVYAAGDVCMTAKFTHAADFAARAVIQNALFFGRKKLSSLTIPWCTYTSPEIAHVGLSEREAASQGLEIATWLRPLGEVDRARADGDEQGFVKIHTKKGSDRIVGATVVARHAGDLISEISVAMAAGMGLGRLASVIHPYPTQAEAIRQLGDAYNRTRLTPGVKRLFELILRLRR
jgi:pyruvate/2-oxoglutarate dehydrogenase complex dihydrolipoamide dehydrogenase (E3) component